MAENNKYQDNIVLTKDAFQDLLTNMKNYPVIDIDYMSENTKDELHTDKDIWETYTDGSPCIRITYGDERNIRGNLTQAERNLLYNKERKLKTKKGELQTATYRKTVLNAAWEQNSIIQDEKIRAIETLKNSANAALSTNKTEFLTEVMSLLNKGYSTTAPQIDTTSTTIVNYSKVTWTSNNASNTPVVITTSFLNATVENNLKLIVKTIQNSTDYNLTTIEKNVLTNIYNFIDNFNNLIFYDAKKQYQGSSKPDPNASNEVWNTYLADLPEDVIQYLDFSNIRQDFNFNTDDNGVYNIITDNILTIVNKILSVIQTNLKALKIEINNLDSIISNLETIISTKETEINNIFNTLKTRVAGTGAATAIYGYKYVKVGNNIDFGNSSIIATPEVSTQAAGTFRIIKNGTTYEVPIKGFSTINDNNNNNIENLEPITIHSTTSITISAYSTTDGAQPIILNGNVGSTTFNGTIFPSSTNNDIGAEGNEWGTIYGTNLGSNDSPFSSIYVDHINISSANSDTGTFYRGDGTWSNELIGPLTVGSTSGGLVVTNTEEAMRYTKIGTTNTPLYQSIGMVKDNLDKFDATANGATISFSTTTINSSLNEPYSIAVEVDSGTADAYPFEEEENSNYKIITENDEYPADKKFLLAILENSFFKYAAEEPKTGIQIYNESSSKMHNVATYKEQYKLKDNVVGNYYIKNSDNTYTECNSGTNYDWNIIVYIQVDNDDPAAGLGENGNNEAIVKGSITTLGGIAARKSIKGFKVHGAVFNDYAEYRHTDNIEPGRCVIETGNGDLILATKRMQLGANIVSDTYGFSIGETNYANTPIAVCGRVLAYTDEQRDLFKPGEAVCSGPNGTVSRMTREEIRNWPDTIVGYVSEIPTYEKWGSDQINVDGRIWIKVK